MTEAPPRPDVPMVDVAAGVAALEPALLRAAADVLRGGQFVLGPQVAAFEAEVADLLGVRHAVGLNSGTDALVIALRALGIGAGDEVVTTPFTFFATAEAVSAVGATPVFADVSADTLTLDPAAAAAALTPRTRAVLPVHLYGHPADLTGLRALGPALVEDTAQAFGGCWQGRPLGTFGDAGAFSFFPSKNLGGFGDGGLLATDRDDVAAAARMLRTHGGRRKYENELVGYNSRLDELQAALLRVKLGGLPAANAGRAAAAARYTELLADVPGVAVPVVRPGAGHAWHQYTVRVPAAVRDAVRASMAAAGVATAVYYPVPVHRLPVYARGGPPPVLPVLPVAEAAAREVLSLPLWPEIPPATQRRVADTLAAALP